MALWPEKAVCLLRGHRWKPKTKRDEWDEYSRERCQRCEQERMVWRGKGA